MRQNDAQPAGKTMYFQAQKQGDYRVTSQWVMILIPKLSVSNFLKAMNEVAALDSEIEINLVDVQTAKTSLLETILSHGQDI